MRNLDFDPKTVESERGVVYSERRSSVDNDNFGVLAEQIQATAYVAHPYQFPTIGWPSDIEGWTIEDLRTYYQRYYAPNNAVVLVAGDVTAAEVFALAEKHLAPIKAQPAPKPVTTREPPQLGRAPAQGTARCADAADRDGLACGVGTRAPVADHGGAAGRAGWR